jgi:periplasmic divalent cation tolerance protein
MTDALVVFVTTGSAAEAEIIARTLVAERLAACVNILNPIRSIYRWEGNLQDDQEWLLVVKTNAAHFVALEERIRALHSYQVPEIIALPVVAGAEQSLRWVRKEVEEL